MRVHPSTVRSKHRSRVKLLLYRGSFFVIGMAILVGGGVSSQYSPHLSSGNNTECTDVQAELVANVSTSIDLQHTSETLSPTPTTVLRLQTSTTQIFTSDYHRHLEPSTTRDSSLFSQRSQSDSHDHSVQSPLPTVHL